MDAAADMSPTFSRLPQCNPSKVTQQVFFISAASEKACQRISSRLAKYLVLKHRASRDANIVLSRLAYTLGKHSIHAYRLALVTSNLDDLVEQLSAAAYSLVPFQERKGDARIALVFSGQGAQYAGMGRELLSSHPNFARSIERACQHLIKLGSQWNLLEELSKPQEGTRINEPALSQPLTTAIQLALVDLLVEFGVPICAVVGHSSGEIAAAYSAKAISFEDAMTASYFRGKLTSDLITGTLKYNGAMLAVSAERMAVDKHISRIGRKLGQMRIACFNSPTSVTVSGDSNTIDELKTVLDSEGTFSRMLSTNGAAYHSHHMEAIEKEYAAVLEKTLSCTHSTFSSSVRMFSSVTGRENEDCTAPDVAYWVTNLLSPVLFSQALHEMCEKQYGGKNLDMIIEVGPHSQLAGAVNQTLKAGTRQIVYASILKRGRDAEISLLECLCTLHVQTAALPIDAINGFSNGQTPELLVDLPPYPFDHERTFWNETRISKNYRHRKHTPHELLGTLSQDTNYVEPRWRRFLSLKESPWLKSHLVQGQIVFPAAGFITMAVQAMRQHMHMANPSTRVKSFMFRNISISRALVLPEDGPDTEIILSLRPEAHTARKSSSIWSEFRIFTVTLDDSWMEHCRGLVHAETHAIVIHDTVSDVEDMLDANMQCTHEANPQRLYYLGHAIGLDWQHPFNNVSSIRTSHSSCTATVRKTLLDTDPGGMGDILHPTVLDSCLFHGLCAVLILERSATSTFVPNFITQLRILNRAIEHSGELVSTSKVHQNAFTCDVVVQDINGSPNQEIILAAQGVHTTTLLGDTALNRVTKNICHSQDWVTYVDAWTFDHRTRICKSVIPPASSLEQNCLLDALALYFVQKAVKEVASDNVPDGPRRHFFNWMQAFASASPDSLIFPQGAVSPDIKTFVEGILRLGPHLSDILTGKTDPLVLLTSDNLLTRLYNVERCDRCIAQIAQYCHELGKQTPGLKILEVGAGTASATLPVLEALNGRGGRYARSYAFTDISPGFFGPAKKRLGDLADVVEFGILDIERCPKEQGFQESSYDLVIASNVIHATQRIDPVLCNIRKLLKPGGKFVIMELTKHTPHYNLLFGVFKGWWAGYDEGRRLSPLIPRSQWVARLKLANFSDPEVWFEDYPEEEGGTISVFLASAPWNLPQAEVLPICVVAGGSPNTFRAVDDKNLATLVTKELCGAQISTYCLSTTSLGDNIVVILPEVARLLCNNPDEYSWQKFKDWVLKARAVVLVSCGKACDLDITSRGLWLGFSRCLRLELPGIRLITLDIGVERVVMMKMLVQVFPALLHSIKLGFGLQNLDELENEFIERDGQLFVSRLVPNQEIGDHIHRSRHRAAPEFVSFLNSHRTLSAELHVHGLLESIYWTDDTEVTGLGRDDVKLELRAASINFKDVLIAAGQLDGITEMRNDCSGVVVEVGSNMHKRFKRGDRVCALYSRSYTNYPIVHGDCCQIVPDDMTFEEAATLPVVWTTVIYSLIDMGRLAKGDKILIHSAAGAVGQAAIMLAQHIGADIFATVGSSTKRELLRQRYGVPDEHIFSSRTSAFHNGIMSLTSGYGVDVVLNSLSGEIFRQSCNLVASFGRFVEIGRKDLMDDARMSMGFLLKNITFTYVDLTLIIEQKKSLARRLLQDVVDLVATGSIKCVTLTVMPISEIEAAFRQIQAGKHTGKIVLRVENDQKVRVSRCYDSKQWGF